MISELNEEKNWFSLKKNTPSSAGGFGSSGISNPRNSWTGLEDGLERGFDGWVTTGIDSLLCEYLSSSFDKATLPRRDFSSVRYRSDRFWPTPACCLGYRDDFLLLVTSRSAPDWVFIEQRCDPIVVYNRLGEKRNMETWYDLPDKELFGFVSYGYINKL